MVRFQKGDSVACILNETVLGEVVNVNPPIIFVKIKSTSPELGVNPYLAFLPWQLKRKEIVIKKE